MQYLKSMQYLRLNQR